MPKSIRRTWDRVSRKKAALEAAVLNTTVAAVADEVADVENNINIARQWNDDSMPLGADLWYCIFQHLSNEHQLRLRRVCTLWRNIGDRALTGIVLHKDLARVGCGSGRAQHRKMVETFADAKRFPRLTQLYLNMPGLSLASHSLYPLQHLFERITEFRMDVSDGSLFSSPPSMRLIDVATLISLLPNLRVLHMNARLYLEGVRVGKTLPPLEELHVAGTVEFFNVNSSLSRLLSLPTLRKLSITNHTRVEDAIFPPLPHTITDLSLRGCYVEFCNSTSNGSGANLKQLSLYFRGASDMLACAYNIDHVDTLNVCVTESAHTTDMSAAGQLLHSYSILKQLRIVGDLQMSIECDELLDKWASTIPNYMYTTSTWTVVNHYSLRIARGNGNIIARTV